MTEAARTLDLTEVLKVLDVYCELAEITQRQGAEAHPRMLEEVARLQCGQDVPVVAGHLHKAGRHANQDRLVVAGLGQHNHACRALARIAPLVLLLSGGVTPDHPARVSARNAVHCAVRNGSRGEDAPSLLSRTPTHPGTSVVISTQSFAPCEYDDVRHPPAWARAAPVAWWFTTAPGLAGSTSP